MEKMTKSYRGVNQCNDGVNRLEKIKTKTKFYNYFRF